jgi:hypothetical protein
MHIDIYVTTNGPYKVEFLNSDYSQMNNPYIAPQLSMTPVDGKLSTLAPSGTYVIPVIKLTNLVDGVVSIAYAYPVSCGANPTPSVPTPVTPPTPIYTSPTPVATCANCRLYLITPTGLGPGAIWTVNYKDCNNVNQSTSGSGLDSPRERYICVGSISIVGEAKIEAVDAPVTLSQIEKVESTRFRVTNNGYLYTDVSAGTPTGYTSYYFIDEKVQLDSSGNAKPFTNIDLSNMAGEMIMCRRLILKNSTFPNYASFLVNGPVANIPDSSGNIHPDFGNSQLLLSVPINIVVPTTKCSFPDWVKATIHPNFDNAPDTSSGGKVVGFTPLLDSLSWAQTKLKGVTHAYRRLNIPKGDRFETIVGADYGLSAALSQPEFNQKGRDAASAFGCNDVVTDQFTEGGGAIPTSIYWNRATAFYKGLIDENNCALGNKCFGSYVDEFNTISGTSKFNINVGGYVSSPLAPYFLSSLRSQANARKSWDRFAQQTDVQDFGFFRSQGVYPAMSTFMGLMTLAYNGFDEPDETQLMFSKFYEIQQKFAAGVRSTLIYHWTGSQSLNLASDVQWRNSGWIIKRDDVSGGSYWEAKNWHSTPVHNTMFLAFIGYLLGEGIVNWESMREFYSKNPAKMHDNTDLISNGRLNWVSPNGSPAPAFNTDSSQYPHGPTCVQDLYLVALDWYKIFKSRMDMGFDVQYLDYTIGGVGVNVNISETNDKRIFTDSIKPFGQHNILHLAANQKGLCIGGSTGVHYAVMYFDPYGDPQVSKDLIVNFGGTLGSVNVGRVRGRGMAVFFSPTSAPTPVTPTPTPVTPTPTGTSYSCTPVFSPLPIGYKGHQKFIVNGTGNSVDFGQPNGISPNKVRLFTQMAKEGVDGIRHTFKLGDYYNGGNYMDSKLTDVNTWTKCLRSDLMQEHLVVPVFTLSESWLNDSDLWKDADGHNADCTFALNKVPSFFSPNAISKKAEIYHHYFAFMKQKHEYDVHLYSFAGGPSEEHYMPYSSNYPGGPGCRDGGYGGIGDYSLFAQQAWKSYQTSRWEGLLPFLIDGNQYASGTAPLPYIRPDSEANRFISLYRRDHREAVRFWNFGVFESWNQFVTIGRQYLPNAKFESFVADMYNPQGILWTLNAGAMHKLMTECDVWYHTENISSDEWAKCLVGTDIVKGGTYGNKKLSSIEFDTTDLGVPNGGAFDENLLEAKLNKFFEYGGDFVHWPLDYSDDQIKQIGRVMRNVRQNKIDNPSWAPYAVSARANADIVTLNTANMFTDTNYIYTAWESTGNSRSNPFASKLMNIRVHDGFYLDEI